MFTRSFYPVAYFGNNIGKSKDTWWVRSGNLSFPLPPLSGIGIEITAMELNAAQKRAAGIGIGKDGRAEHSTLILGGPGCGKTHTLVYRLKELVGSGTLPESVIAVSFTKEAADSLSCRICGVMGEDVQKLILDGTFHSIAYSIMKMVDSKHKRYSIIEGVHQGMLIDNILSNCSPSIYAGKGKYAIRNATKNWLHRDRGRMAPAPPGLAPLLELYAELKVRMGYLDFDDLLEWWLRFLGSPEGAEFGRAYSHILIDEVQDMNRIQKMIVKRLHDMGVVITAIGDDRQTIYGFRGTVKDSLNTFASDYSPTKIVTLNVNYRNPPLVSRAAESVVASVGHLPREPTVCTNVEEVDGEEVCSLIPVHMAASAEQEVATLVKRILRDRAESTRGLPSTEEAPPGQSAIGAALPRQMVLSRYHKTLDGIEKALIREGIPYSRKRGPPEEVRLFLAMLVLSENATEVDFPRDSHELATCRLVPSILAASKGGQQRPVTPNRAK